MEIESIAGLPAHPLVVHAAVVLVPLAVIGLLVTGWRASWRKAYSLPVALIAVAGAIAAYLAVASGDPLEDAVEDAAENAGVRARFGDHPEQGEQAQFFAITFAVLAVAFWAVNRWGPRLGLPKWVPFASYLVAVIPGLVALALMIAAGHSGAELVWKDLGSFAAGS